MCVCTHLYGLICFFQIKNAVVFGIRQEIDLELVDWDSLLKALKDFVLSTCGLWKV